MGYLKETPGRNWERIAFMVEDALPDTPRAVARRAFTAGCSVSIRRRRSGFTRPIRSASSGRWRCTA